MIVNSPTRLPAWPARPTGGFGFWPALIQLGSSLLGGQKQGPTVQPAQLPSTAAIGGSDTGLYIGLGVGAIAITGLAVFILRSPAPKPVAGYRRSRR